MRLSHLVIVLQLPMEIVVRSDNDERWTKMTGDKRSVLGELRRGRAVISHQPSFLFDHPCSVIIDIFRHGDD